MNYISETPTIVSVAIPVLNRRRSIARAVESLLVQMAAGLEIVVVDGGSTDGTLELLTQLRCPNLRVVSEPDRGISDAFNKGIKLSHGKFIGILAADDWYEPCAVRTMIDALAGSGADIAHGASQLWDGAKRGPRVMGDHTKLRRRMSICHPTVFVRRECYDRIGLFRLDYHYAMDYEWLLRALIGGAKFQAVTACITNMDLGGTSDRNWRAAILETARARAEHLQGHSHKAHFYAQAWMDIVRSGGRRMFDHLGLAAPRRAFHRLFSKGNVDFPDA